MGRFDLDGLAVKGLLQRPSVRDGCNRLSAASRTALREIVARGRTEFSMMGTWAIGVARAAEAAAFLKAPELREWLSNEVNGYGPADVPSLPAYRRPRGLIRRADRKYLAPTYFSDEELRASFHEGFAGLVALVLPVPVGGVVPRPIPEAARERAERGWGKKLDVPREAVTQAIETVALGAKVLLEELDALLLNVDSAPSLGAPPRSASVSGARRFRVALSFPGERRGYVGEVADGLAAALGRERVLYDRFHEAEFARFNLDTHLQTLYHDDSDLIVVFLCKEYAEKEWCGLEFRAIRDVAKTGRAADVMLLRFDDAAIPGVLSIDGYVDLRGRTAAQAAGLVLERARQQR